MSKPVCPSCKKANDPEMGFCIFCGSSLKPGSVSGRKPTLAPEACPSCGKTDPLSGKFCVLCGAAMPASSAAQNGTANALTVESAVETLPKAAPARPRGGSRMVGLIAGGIFVGAALGTGLALAVGLYQQQVNQPSKGLVIAGTPNTGVLVSDKEQKTFIVGDTGSDGHLIYDLEPGTYSVKVGEKAAVTTSVSAGKATVLPAAP